MAELAISAGRLAWSASTSLGVSVKPYAKATEQVSAFGLPPASAAPVKFGEWEGSVDAGASVNCPIVTLCAHSSGTHTECVGHVLPGTVTLSQLGLTEHFFPAFVLSVTPEPWEACSDAYEAGAAGDSVVSQASLEKALGGAQLPRDLRCVVLRTLPNEPAKRSKQWSGSNPPFLSPAAMAWLRAAGVEHLIVDLPSVDKEDDGGHLLAHRTFWGIGKGGACLTGGPGADSAAPGTPQLPAAEVGAGGVPLASAGDDDSAIIEAARSEGAATAHIVPRTITELAFVPDTVPDGPAMVVLAVPLIDADASPSNPLLVPYAE